LDCTGSFRRHTVAPKGIVSLWGAVYNLSYIESSINVPTVMIHGTADFIVPYTEGRPFTAQFPSTFPWVYGSTKMDARLTSTNIYHEFYSYPGQGHIFYGLPTGIVTFPNQYWNPVFNQGRNFLYKIMSFDTPTPSGNASAAYNSTSNYSVPLRAGSTYCWSVTGGTIIGYSTSNSIVTVKWNASGTRKITAIETDYKQLAGTPATLVITSSVRMSSGITMVNAPAKQFELYPNPLKMGQSLSLKINAKEAGSATFTLYNLVGHSVKNFSKQVEKEENTIEIATNDLPSGIYLISMSLNGVQETLKLYVD
jgi:hypothetical protein